MAETVNGGLFCPSSYPQTRSTPLNGDSMAEHFLGAGNVEIIVKARIGEGGIGLRKGLVLLNRLSSPVAFVDGFLRPSANTGQTFGEPLAGARSCEL